MQGKIFRLLKKKLPYLQFMGLILLAVSIVGFAGISSVHVYSETGKKVEDTSSIKACAECHEDMVAIFKGSSHGVMKNDCSDCHGDTTKHLSSGEAGTIMAFKNENVQQKTKQCLSCHTKSSGRYMSGEHAKVGMDCTKCHSIHKGKHSMTQLKTKMCASCHQDVVAEFKLNERHRLKEGILECTSCHNPHEPAARARLGGFKQESCLKCHRDKGGPFIYEHEASILEGCTVCHEVHGSPNRHMLKHQSEPELCLSCHTLTPSWHSRFTVSEANCTSCHSTIHGSNLDKIFLK